MHLFVPGRICLFGEHSDWAGAWRRQNPALERGHALIAATNQGLHARVAPHTHQLILRATHHDGRTVGPLCLAMNAETLRREAEGGGFFSYAAGTALRVLERHRVGGLLVDNHRTDLPIRKGLSSSAALCVLLARAFNQSYSLGLDVRQEMELAWLGETATGSRCGRMDQGCAWGGRPIRMDFDGDGVEMEPLAVGADLHLAIVDLHAAKDTRIILDSLNQAYPFATTQVQREVQRYLGPLNIRIVEQAIQALAAGDAPRLGTLMAEAQAAFDHHLGPACPGQLSAPALHRVLAYGPIQPLIWGGKGVGSQGDGSAQLLARSEEERDRVGAILQAELGLTCLPLTIRAG